MRCAKFAGGGLLLLISIACAQAQAPASPPPDLTSAMAPMSWAGPYLGLQLGAGSISEKLTESTSFDPPQTGHANRDSAGVAGGAHAGFNWQFGGIVFGPEGDLEGVASSRSSGCLLQDAGAGNLAPNTCFPSALGYRFNTTIDWQASLRARLGYAFGDALFYGTGGAAFAGIRTSYSQSSGGVNTAQSFSETRTGFTVGAGLEYAFDGNWRGRLEYRYTDYGKFTDNTATSAGTFWDGYANHHTIRENTVRIGLTYEFGAPPAMPEVAAAPPPPSAKVFIVFFDWDKDTITRQGMAIIRAAADTYRSGMPVRIQVTGYTDRSGSPGYNQRLSERRAGNVANALAGFGVPRAQMAVSGRGENDNRVATADGVREPQNRRVEIVAP
jgi:outer membrane immunogenic protein